MADVGKKARKWLTDKLGNPIMPSKEKDQIAALEEEERKAEQEAKDKQQQDVIDQYERRVGPGNWKEKEKM